VTRNSRRRSPVCVFFFEKDWGLTMDGNGNRSQCNSGTNGMMSLANGGERTGWKIGRLRMMAGCGRGR